MGRSVTFSDGTNPAVTIQGPVETDVRMLPRFVSGRTANHGRYSYIMTSTQRWEWTLVFRQLPLADKNALEDFFRNTVNGPTSAFTYTHTSGQAYAGCRFAQEELSMVRLDDATWDLTVVIDVPSQIAH